MRAHVALAVLVAAVATSSILLRPDSADAHGSVSDPPSRTYVCRFVEPDNPACARAWAANAQALYDWHEVNIGDADGRHRQLIGDGELCGAGREKYAAFNEASADWPATAIAPAADGLFHFAYEATAPHATEYYRFYLTTEGFDPTVPIDWDDLELVHDSGPLPASPSNEFAVDLPDRSGRHVLYQVWQRSDSPEAFYSCSDVVLGDASPAPDPRPSPTPQPTPTPTVLGGYWMVEADGQVHGFGDAGDHGGDGAGAVSVATTPSGSGLWVLRADGSVRALDGAAHHGEVSPGTLGGGESPSALSVLADGSGYWVFTDRGRAVAFGAATHHGDMAAVELNGSIVASSATPSGDGYYMIGSDGGVFAFGDAEFAGSMGGLPLNAPVVGIAPDPDGRGYWLVANDGGIFAFDAEFAGSMGGRPLNRPVIGAAAFADAYLLVGTDGGIFNFSEAPFFGSLGSSPPDTPVLAVAAFAS